MQNSVKILEIFPSMLGSQTESTDIEQIVSRAWDKPGVFKLTWRLSTNLPNWGSPSLLVDLDSWTLTTTKKTSTVRSRLRCWVQTQHFSGALARVDSPTCGLSVLTPGSSVFSYFWLSKIRRKEKKYEENKPLNSVVKLQDVRVQSLGA